jgi:hypothetical protein
MNADSTQNLSVLIRVYLRPEMVFPHAAKNSMQLACGSIYHILTLKFEGIFPLLTVFRDILCRLRNIK